MAYDEALDGRIADLVADWDTTRKPMFGGTGYMLRGNMLAGVYKDSLVLRLGEQAGDEALARPHVRVFDITGRPMKGWIMVDPGGFDGEELARWLLLAKAHVEKLPAK